MPADSEPSPGPPTRAGLNARLKRNLSFWAIRWVAGLGFAIAIVAFTGQYHWLPWAAVAVALVSLLVLLGMHMALMRKIDGREKALRQDDDANT